MSALRPELCELWQDGFGYEGNMLELISGSWNRNSAIFESGANNGTWGYYFNLSHFEEDGWRKLSASYASNAYASLNWRAGENAALNFNFQYDEQYLFEVNSKWSIHRLVTQNFWIQLDAIISELRGTTIESYRSMV